MTNRREPIEGQVVKKVIKRRAAPKKKASPKKRALAVKSKKQQDLAVQQDPQIEFMQMLERMAGDPNVDVDKMQKILDMRERIVDKEAEQKFNQAMVACQAELPTIQKTGFNKHTDSKFAKLENINSAIIPIITKHGFSLIFGTGDAPVAGSIQVTCDVLHSGGHSKRYKFDLAIDDAGAKGGATKTKVHGSGSTITYGRRYLTTMIFNLILAGEDIDGNPDKPLASEIEMVSEEQIANLETLLLDANIDVARFLKWRKFESMAKIPAENYPALVERIQKEIN